MRWEVDMTDSVDFKSKKVRSAIEALIIFLTHRSEFHSTSRSDLSRELKRLRFCKRSMRIASSCIKLKSFES